MKLQDQNCWQHKYDGHQFFYVYLVINNTSLCTLRNIYVQKLMDKPPNWPIYSK